MNNTITITQERYDQLLAAEKALAELTLWSAKKKNNAVLVASGNRVAEQEDVFDILGDDGI